jgi:PAS domain S-box-containing protein
MTVLQTMSGTAVIVRVRARRVFVLGTVLASLLSVALPRARALDPDRRISQYGHTVWRIQDGAISPSTSIAQTTDGFLWVGTAQGLMRFDGVRFMPWQPPQGQNLPGTHFSALLGSHDGSLWIGTTRGLARWKGGQLRTYTDLEHPAPVAAIMEDASGTIWATRYGPNAREAPLCSITKETLRCFGKKDGIPVGYALGLTHDSEGNIWLGGKVLVRWRPGTPATTYFGETAELARTDGVIDVALGPSGTVWATLDGTGPQLGVRYYSGGRWASYAVPGFDGARVRSGALLVDRRGSLWVGTQSDGVYRISGGVADHYGVSDGLSGNTAGNLFEDREGNIWVETDGGLDMFRDTALISYTTRQGISDSHFQSVMALRNGAVWIGTDGGLNILRNPDGKTAIFDRKLSGHGVGPMLEDRSGVVWLGVGLALMRFQNGRFREIQAPGGQSFVSLGGVSGIAEDSSGMIWLLTHKGQLFSIVGNQIIKEQASPTDELGRQKYLVADPNGGLWIGAPKGTISFFRDGRLQPTSLSSPQGPADIRAPLVDSDNSLLVPSSLGLYRLNHGQVTLFGSDNGLPCPDTFNVIRDNHGALWIYTRCGMVRIAESEWAKWIESPHVAVSVMVLGALDGAQAGTGDSYQPRSSKAPDGRLWFETGVSIQVLDPDRLYENALPPPVRIEDVIADRKTYSSQGSLPLPALTRDLEIDYTALSFVIPQKVHFEYKLEGYDRDWQDAGTRRQAFYSNLPPRNYTFRVKASNNSGLWNEAGASLDFFVAPANYQTLWFRSLGVFLFLAVLAGLYRLRLGHLERQRDALRKSEKELRDVIDTIPALVWSALPDGSNIYVNKRFEEYTGSSGEQVAGSGWQSLVHPDDLERHAGNWRGAVATGKTHESEVRSRRADGQYRWQLDRGVPLRDKDGNIVKWYGVTTDIEDRKRAEEALQLVSSDLEDSKAKLEEAQRIAHVGHWQWDLTSNRVTWSDETYRIYGLRPQEHPIDIAVVRQMIHPDDLESVFRVAEESVRGGLRTDVEHRIIRPGGEVRTVHSQGDVKKDASGRPCQMFGTVQDITDRKHAEEALQRSQFYISEGQRLAHMGSWAFNPSGFFEYWSQELFKVYGLDPEKGAPTLEQYLATVHPHDRDFMADTIKRMQAERSGCDVKKRIVRPDGEQRYIRCVGIPVVEGGILKGFLGTAIDITEQELLNQELERRQAHLTEAQKLTHTGSWAWRLPDRKAIHLSEEWYRIYGFDPAGGAPTWEEYIERVHPEDRLKWAGIVERAIVEKGDYGQEFRILLPNGTVKWIRTVGHPVFSGTGDLEQYVGSSTDITERKSAEQALQRSEAYLVEGQRLSHTGSWAWNPASDNTYYSEECYRLLGFAPGDGTPPPLETVIQRIHPDDQAQCREQVEKAIRDKVDFELDYRIVHPDKRVRDIHCVCHTVLDRSGDLVELLGTVIDITERKSAEQEREKLRQLEADLAHTNRVSTLGEMAASLAHEIKQPIAAAITSANSCIEWLAHEPPNLDRARAAAARIDTYGNRAAEIIDRIRSFYRKSPSQRELVNVNGIVQEMLTLLMGEATRYSVAMRTDLAGELPNIKADRVQLQQVFMNLMLNALEAMRDSGGELTVKSQLRDGQLQFSVSDTGVGLPAEEMDQIFSAFFTTKPQGSGMGLAISRSIVESHGGRLWAGASSARGASFHFTLPVSE